MPNKKNESEQLESFEEYEEEYFLNDLKLLTILNSIKKSKKIGHYCSFIYTR